MNPPAILPMRAGGLEAGVVPEVGGSLSHFRRVGGVNYMRSADPDDLAARDPVRMACFPLVPFSGRIAKGRLNFDGATYELPINAPPDSNALHGDGWQCPWRVESAGDRDVQLVLDDPGRGWPWPYCARQSYSLSEAALTITLSVTNLSDRPMPTGVGIHPWFDVTPNARLKFEAESVYHVDDGYLFTEVTSVPPEWNFAAGRPIDGTDLVNGFTGWTGGAEITWPEWGQTLTIAAKPPLTQLVVYTPAGQNFFCVEPVSHAVDSFNLEAAGVAPDNGTIVLNPDQTLDCSATFSPG